MLLEYQKNIFDSDKEKKSTRSLGVDWVAIVVSMNVEPSLDGLFEESDEYDDFGLATRDQVSIESYSLPSFCSYKDNLLDFGVVTGNPRHWSGVSWCCCAILNVTHQVRH